MFDTCSFKPTNDGFPPSSGGGGGAVTSVFGRTGAVIAVAGDYNSTQITNSSSVSGAFVTDALNTLNSGKLSTTLTSANIIVGNGSNVATAVAMSGDATISNTGAVTLANTTVVAATYGSATQVPVFAVDSKGRITGVTNTTITGGGTSYNIQSQTLSADVAWDATNFTPNNVQYLVTNNATTRTLTINNTGFVAGDLIQIIVAESSPGNISIVIGGVTTFTQMRASGIQAIFDGTNWNIYPLIGGANTSDINSHHSFAVGFASNVGLGSISVGYNVNGSGTDGVAIGNSSTNSVAQSVALGVNASVTGNNSISIGYNNSGSGANSVRVGSGTSTGTNTGVVAIGQGITTTNTDAVVIGRASAAGGTGSITIGAGSTGNGSNSIRIGNGISTNLASSIVAIGQGITSISGNSVVIGRAASGSGGNYVTIGDGSSGTGGDSVIIGQDVAAGSIAFVVGIGKSARLTKIRQFAKGTYAYPQHYGAESRRIDTNTSATDTTYPSSHLENYAWIGTTTNNTATELFLFGVSNERVTLQDNESILFEGQMYGYRNATNYYMRSFLGVIQRGSGVGSTTIIDVVFYPTTNTLGTGGTCSFTLTADTTNGSLKCNVTGNAAETWYWRVVTNSCARMKIS